MVIREAQDIVLQHTHGSLQQWTSDLVKALLEQEPASAGRLLAREKCFIAAQFSRITGSLTNIPVDTAIYELAVKMGSHTREAEGCLLDVEEKTHSGQLLNSYIHRTLYSDLYTR